MNLYTFNKLKVGDKVRINKKGDKVYRLGIYDGIVIETQNSLRDGIIKIKIDKFSSIFFPDEIDCKL